MYTRSPNTSTRGSIDSIPPELFLSIVSYLPVKDIGNLSLASIPFRLSTLSYLFRCTRLYPESITAFQSGGSLSQAAGFVQQLTLDTANGGLGGLNDICDFIRACIGGSDLGDIFPNVTQLKIVFPLEMNELNCYTCQRILKSTLLGFSKISFYHKLKALVFKGEIPDELVFDPTVFFDSNTNIRLTSENLEFFGSINGEDGKPINYIPDPWAGSDGLLIFPTSLKGLSCSTPQHYKSFPGMVGPKLLHAASSIANSLEKVELPTILKIPNSFIFHGIVYFNVKELSLGLDTLAKRYPPQLQEVVRTFPNLERFKLSLSAVFISAKRQTLLMLCPDLVGLTKLRRVVIEIPMRDMVHNPDHPKRRGPKNILRPANHISIAVIIESVTFWLGAGLKNLENAEFRLSFTPSVRAHRPRGPILEMLKLYCEVVRESSTWRLEWKSVRTNYETGEVHESNFISLPSFSAEEYLVAAGL